MSGGNAESVALTPRQYEGILNAADTYREALVVRLCGEVGLRPVELARLRPGDVRQLRDDPPRYGLAVRDGSQANRGKSGADVDDNDGDSTDDLGSETTARIDRIAFLPTHVERDLRRYATSNGIDEGDRLVPVTARRLQMLVAEVTTRAGEVIDDPMVASTSSSDLRRYFAHRALVAHDVNPRAVKAAGGWHSFEALEPYLPEPSPDELVEAFEPLERPVGGTAAHRHRHVEAPQPRLEATDGDNVEAGSAVERRHPDPETQQAVTAALLEASTHEAIEEAVCAALLEGRAYEFAWFDRTAVAGNRRTWRVADDRRSALVEQVTTALEAVDRVQSTDSVQTVDVAYPANLDGDIDADIGDADGDGDGGDTVTIHENVVESDVFEGPVATVPIRYGDTVYGTLGLGAHRSDAFDDRERAWLETVGRQIGHAIAAVRRRNLLLSDAVVELEFVCRDEGSFFVDAAGRLDCRFELDSLIPVEEHTQLYYVTVTGAGPAAVFDLVETDPGIDDCRVIETYEGGSRLEFVVEGSSPTLTLMEYGVTVLESVTDGGATTITAECASDTDIRTVVDGLRSSFPGSELVGKRTVERSVQTAREFQHDLHNRLTDRQEAALRAAYSGGYYDWPRESTAEEIADAMGISSPTLHNHLRKGQHELLRTFFDASTVDGDARDR
ncbi:bacterio-opsin activator domain-containing protein [Natronosalvus vescus]|uniref:bacterio-opsin activator domain-containing protein n=1 Tax=Natronosalvus vescus TaxID=2953881 RepID=UPI0020912DBF|nr:bacterio-opsin activator domain-containing protein [Natronosalvus vescus]